MGKIINYYQFLPQKVYLFPLLAKIPKSNTTQAAINNIPPTGVIKAIEEMSTEVISRVVSKYIEPEKNSTPNNVRIKAVFFFLSEIKSVIPTKSKNKA